MSADNFVTAFPFEKSTGQVVWRVMEVTLSSCPYQTVHNMSTKARYREFLEFSGPDAYNHADANARRIMRSLSVCEYGVAIAERDAKPSTMQDLLDEATKAGYDVADLREASDAFLAKLPRNNWLPWPDQP